MDQVPVLRGYRPGDLDALFAIDVECFSPIFRFPKDSLRRFVEARGAFSLVAEDRDGVAGFIVVQVKRTKLRAAAYVVTLDVREAYRRTGLGSRLMGEAERRALQEGAACTQLHVFVSNTAARAFYARLGYEPRSLAKNFYGAALDALVMERRLPATSSVPKVEDDAGSEAS